MRLPTLLRRLAPARAPASRAPLFNPGHRIHRAFGSTPAEGRDELGLAGLHAARARLDWAEVERLALGAAAEAPQALAAWAWCSIEAATDLAAGRRELFGDPQPVIDAELRAADLALTALHDAIDSDAGAFGALPAAHAHPASCEWRLALEERAVAQFGAGRLPRSAARVEARALRAVVFGARSLQSRLVERAPELGWARWANCMRRAGAILGAWKADVGNPMDSSKV
ncbi:hypothetical protein [Burkholderia pseudomallei]|uniref:hypothetical protein n=1 Tax=Burkholderia pseudomallei TaxID=28450 RepID=UPI000F078423|nr:hypothetical protein [Burkholderia pseudomallei]CAJ3077511.1 Uncharacterised protein [Burkholderia pseudomallei]VCK72435.1 Uncharacterised protein [Burkholderia pseudomallei]VCK79824.1 Uncharacterised protein [Burkholderia pseudomallei]VCK80180.1 Uncharacterised protein [Burkholderia pseudomallei]VCK80637.1 Uncharacterised protein [Burkholderia pseudomallei]